MTEISFARSFLSALDARPIKITSDHITDPRQLPSGVGYTIAKYPSAPNKRKRGEDGTSSSTSSAARGAAGGQSSKLNITLKSMKSAEHSLSLDGETGTSSIFDLKQGYATKFNVPVDKIKLLYAKKPVADSKTLKDVLGDETGGKGGDVEFAVMLMGGVVPSVTPAADDKDEKSSGKSEGKVVDTDEFWKDLKSFLEQRVGDEVEASRLTTLFRKAAA